MKLRFILALWLFWNLPMEVFAQQFALEKKTDSLYVLTLTTDSTRDEWRLPYPVYRLCTGDVNGDGSTDALVGVVKRTRFYKEVGRRLFIFKNKRGHIRPLWMGSKLGGILQDFRFVNGMVRSLETTTSGQYVVAEYSWMAFGLSFNRFLCKQVGRTEALKIFNQ
ncbi:MAG TPA: hypothetical protein VIQ97_01685 [Prevotella sp.]